MRFLGIASCINKNALSQQLVKSAKAATAMMGKEFELAQIGNLPLFDSTKVYSPVNADRIRKFRNEISAANGLVLCASETPLGYPYSISGPLKNAFDWASLPPNVLHGKPALFLSVDSPSKRGVNCYHLRELAIICGLKCIPNIQVCLTVEEVDALKRTICASKMARVQAELRVALKALEAECNNPYIPAPNESHKFHLVHPSVRNWKVTKLDALW